MLARRTLNDLGSAVRLNAQRSPGRAAVVEVDGRTRSYAQLDERSSRLANALRGLGLEPGDRVAGWMGDVVEYVELYVAAANAQLVVVPINNRLTAAEAAYQLDRTAPRALLHTPDVAERVAELPGRSELIAIETGDRLDTLIQDARDAPLAPPHPDAPWIICFTSGTTGHPKGAVLTHGSVMTLAQSQYVALRIPLQAVNIQAVSMSFPATVCSHLVPHLMVGGTQILAAAKWDSDRLLDLIARVGGTHIYVPGPALAEFSDAAEADPARWRTLTSVLHAGSRADPAALERLAAVVGRIYLEGWGMTEISGGVGTATTVSDYLTRGERFFSTVGRPVQGTMVVAVGADREPLAAGEEGELALLSPSLFAGYWDDPAATAAAVQDGWYYSGDMGAVDEDGYVYISDRRTNLIVSGGMNVYPAELELVLERCPGVAECAIVGLPHERWGQTPVAVIVREAGAAPVPTADAVIAFAAERLAGYKKPTRVLFVDELPRTVGGKVRRGVLRELLASQVTP
jgi:fatty-acyl-CoA synthase